MTRQTVHSLRRSCVLNTQGITKKQSRKFLATVSSSTAVFRCVSSVFTFLSSELRTYVNYYYTFMCFLVKMRCLRLCKSQCIFKMKILFKYYTIYSLKGYKLLKS
jgi:hypothetical protein